MLEPVDDALRIVEQVGDEHDQAALDERVGELVERPADIGRAPGCEPLEREQQRVQVARPGARRGTRDAMRSSKAMSPAASRCRFIRYASDAASTEPYSSLVIGAGAAYAIDALTSSSRWHSRLVSSSNFLT